MKLNLLTLMLATLAISCGEDKEDTAAETDVEIEDSDTETEDTETEDTDTEDTETEDTDTEDTETEDTNTEDTNTEDPLADAQCDAGYANCTEQDFANNDFTGSTQPVSINMVGMQPYAPKCVTVKVGQTVRIGATGGHPFSVSCAEDSVMDSQDGSTSEVEFTFSTPGYYNYRCGVPSHNSMVGNIKVLP